MPAFAAGDPASSLGVVLEGAVRVGDGFVRGPGAVFAAEDFARAFGAPVQRRWNATATDEGVLVAALDATHAARLDEIRPGAAAAVMRAAADAACAGGNNATETIDREDDEDEGEDGGDGQDRGDGDGEFLSAASAVSFAQPDEPELCFPPETQIRRLALADAFEHHTASSSSSMESVVGFLREAFDARDGPRGDDERSSNLAGTDASLASLSDDEVRRFARRCAALEVAAGRQIVRPGRRREFSVFSPRAGDGGERRGAIVAELAPGAWIGEAGYVTGDESSRSGTRRDAAVVSAVDGTVVIAASIFAAREMDATIPRSRSKSPRRAREARARARWKTETYASPRRRSKTRVRRPWAQRANARVEKTKRARGFRERPQTQTKTKTGTETSSSKIRTSTKTTQSKRTETKRRRAKANETNSARATRAASPRTKW